MKCSKQLINFSTLCPRASIYITFLLSIAYLNNSNIGNLCGVNCCNSYICMYVYMCFLTSFLNNNSSRLLFFVDILQLYLQFFWPLFSLIEKSAVSFNSRFFVGSPSFLCHGFKVFLSL